MEPLARGSGEWRAEAEAEAGEGTDSLEDGIGVQVDANDVMRRVVKVEVAGVDAHNEGHRGRQNVSQSERAQRDVRALPMQRKNHLQEQTKEEQSVSGSVSSQVEPELQIGKALPGTLPAAATPQR